MANEALSTNSIALIALANEYCHAIETIEEAEEPEAFIASMLKMLPRIYITASDVTTAIDEDESYYVESYLDETTYDQVRSHIAEMMGDEDTYLEVFEEDMKYSDTPIAVTVSESLADIYQDLYNFVAAVKDAPTEAQQEIIGQCKQNFDNYWGQTLCNVLRALHNIRYGRGLE
ncbi:MAG: DUF5063 domain-containing protein [Muribaculaceae bacterium]|jgi:site-specific DNA-adenine methylase|nr:DUF5063 domain-containing protein [Muribaculaceae bacterium]